MLTNNKTAAISSGSGIIFLCKRYLIMQQICIGTADVTELKTLYTCMEYFLFRILLT